MMHQAADSRAVLITTTVLVVVIGLLTAGMLSLGLDGLSGTALDQVLTLRSYRLVIGALAGAALAVAGVLTQGLFRNPLADPGIIGTGAGAVLGGLLALMLYHAYADRIGTWLPPEALLPLFCLLGAVVGLLPLLIVLRFTRDRLAVLLFGVVLTLLFGSVSTLLRNLVQDWELARAMLGFGSGGIGDKGLTHIGLALPLVGIGSLVAWSWSRRLDLLGTGEDEAVSLGLNLRQLRLWSIVWVAVLVAAAVSLAGNVGFVGLMVPHIIRRLTGPHHASLIPLAALAGAAFVLLCDLIGRALVPTGQLPLGVVTGLIGAPVFLVLLFGRGRHWS